MTQRLITIIDPATGAAVNCVAVEWGREVERVPVGMTWAEGEHYGRFCTATGAPLDLLAFADDVMALPNRLIGIPAGTRIIAGDVLREAVDGEVVFTVEFPETIRVRLIHPLYDPDTGVFAVECSPEKNPETGGEVVEQHFARMRIGGYAEVASQPDQLDAIIKAVRAIIAHLPPAVTDQIPADALAVLDGIADVKVRIPKKGQPA